MLLKHGKNDEFTVYVPKETILNEMAAKMRKLSQHLFFGLVWKLFNSTSYNILRIWGTPETIQAD
jgi:hypothetical protein